MFHLFILININRININIEKFSFLSMIVLYIDLAKYPHTSDELSMIMYRRLPTCSHIHLVLPSRWRGGVNVQLYTVHNHHVYCLVYLRGTNALVILFILLTYLLTPHMDILEKNYNHLINVTVIIR